MKIYFAASIRSGRDDWASYLEIVGQLREYGQVLTEHDFRQRTSNAERVSKPDGAKRDFRAVPSN
ncbi:MAG: hypothetical protein ACR2HX_02585 [Pyrinomonadaceae bacterium]